jgi:ribosome maturation factor RimP
MLEDFLTNMPDELAQHLWNLIEPVLTPENIELVDLEYRPQGKRSLLRIYIDRPHGVTIDDCALIARQVGALLDIEDPIPGAYDLEVSSPGINRVLRKEEHFAEHIGAPVIIKTKDKLNGRANFKGILEKTSQDSVALNVAGEIIDIGLNNIKKARLDLPEEELFRSAAAKAVDATGE